MEDYLLIRRIKDGDTTAFEQLTRKYYGHIFAYCYRRAGIAQALLNDPKILVVDEPTAGLDPKERVKFRHTIEQLEKDRIIILSTHIVPDVEKLCDDVIIMKDGRKVHYGPEHENLETLYLQFFDEKEGDFDEPYDD